MSQQVRISVHPHELSSALDAIHQWSSQFDWGGTSGSPSFVIELDIVSDAHGLAKKFTGNKFDQPEARSVSEPTNEDRILDMIKNQKSTTFSLLDHLRGGAQ